MDLAVKLINAFSIIKKGDENEKRNEGEERNVSQW
jgi:hypothetical protein